ncbi:hypothetical protein C8J57DRAFT_1260125 [Mycena rebaudengoi]|nr:hypothetical protein C8J57DRAFT_1260125 [Mycena rebaudengoi]
MDKGAPICQMSLEVCRLRCKMQEQCPECVDVGNVGHAPDCQLKTTCPACTNKLEGEADLIFDMLVTKDGNDSLKRVLWKEHCDYDNNGKPLPSASKEQKDPCVDIAGKDYYLSRDTVDLWAKE